jgi:hypothetical protein
MNERLPIWLQAIALACLSCALILALGWVGANEEWIRRAGLEHRAHHFVYLMMSLPIVILGGRFVWRFRARCKSGTTFEKVCYWLGVAFTLPSVILLALWFRWPLIKVREAELVIGATAAPVLANCRW